MPIETRKALGKGAMTMPEIEVKAALKSEKELHRQFENYLRLVELPFGTARMDRKSTFTEGWPDYTLVIKGRAIFIECKMPGKDLEPEQQRVCALLAAMGAYVRICESLQECIETVKMHLEPPSCATSVATQATPSA